MTKSSRGNHSGQGFGEYARSYACATGKGVASGVAREEAGEALEGENSTSQDQGTGKTKMCLGPKHIPALWGVCMSVRRER